MLPFFRPCENHSISIQFSCMKKICTILIFLVFSQALFSQSPETQSEQESSSPEMQADQNLTVTNISFVGLKKTRNSYIQTTVKKFINEPLTDENLHDLETALQLEGLFDDIQISIAQTSNTEAEITVSVKEKITFIPLPFAMYSSSTGFKAGAFLMDMNTFGKKDMTIAGLMWSPKTIMSVGMFKHAPKIGAPGFMVAGNLSKATSIICDSNGDDVLEFDNFNAGISSSILF